MDVVEADHSDLGSDGAAHIGDRIEYAEGHHVAEADNAVDIGILVSSPIAASRACGRAGSHTTEAGSERQAVVVQECCYATCPPRVLRSRQTADEGDSAAAVAVEMLRGRIPAVAVLRAHVIDIQPVQAAGHEDQGCPADPADRRRGAVSRHQYNAVHIAFDERPDQAALQFAILAAGGQQWHRPATGEGVLQAGGELGEVRVGDVGQHHPDGVACWRA